MCEYYSKINKVNFKSLMPPNLYGPNDNYDLKTSHFYPALFKKIFMAKKRNLKILKILGTGKAKRETSLVLIFLVAIVIKNGMKILGVSLPEKM